MAATQDPWEVEVVESKEKGWSEMSSSERAMYVATWISKIVAAVALLYLFIISLGLMGDAFKILGGPSAGEVFRNSDIFDNPIAGLMLGVLATVLVQSSSTSTSIIISMTAAKLMTVKNAIPMIMGANIGTSVTNTIVSLAQIGDKDQYRRAFAGATVHDCFNLLTVIILLPLEAITGMLRHIAKGIVDAAGIDDETEKGDKVDFLKKITKPVTKRLVAVDKKLVEKVAEETDPAKLDQLLKQSMIKNSRTTEVHLFMDTPMNDEAAGWLLLIISLAFLTTCLILLVKILQSIFRGRVAIWMKGLLNLEFKSVPFVADYVLVAFGAGITILMQSSSITTSTLTPLVGIGLVRLEKMFPFTVGANIGTTVTGILSALASSDIPVGLQVALAHLFFNLIGTLIWFPIPCVRAVPLGMARFLGNMAADMKIFPLAYIFVVFAVIPGALLGLSLAGDAWVAVIGTLLALCMIALITVMVLRARRPTVLPGPLRQDPAWLPDSLRVEPREEQAANGHRAQEEGGRAQAGNADLGGEDEWWQAPMAWGLGTFVWLMLLMAVPNCQWAIVEPATWDTTRIHMGVGTWEVCSKSYEADMNYAAERTIATCTPDILAANCTQGLADCVSDESFSSTAGANSQYEKSWLACAEFCTPAAWKDWCLSQACGGSQHAEQCSNVTSAVQQDFTVSYGQGQAWSAGGPCRDVGDFCDNGSDLKHVGNLAAAGTAVFILGQVLLLVYVFMRKGRDLRLLLAGALGAYALSWLLLLISWALFTGLLSADVTCTVQDNSGAGAVIAKGQFDKITNGANYSYGFIIGAWCLITLILPIVAWQLRAEWRGGATAAAKQEETEQV